MVIILIVAAQLPFKAKQQHNIDSRNILTELKSARDHRGPAGGPLESCTSAAG